MGQNDSYQINGLNTTCMISFINYSCLVYFYHYYLVSHDILAAKEEIASKKHPAAQSKVILSVKPDTALVKGARNKDSHKGLSKPQSQTQKIWPRNTLSKTSPSKPDKVVQFILFPEDKCNASI
jgi:hypothetical protein